MVCSFIGTAILNTLKVNCFERVGDRAIVSLWLGVLILALGLLAVSWFAPLSPIRGVGFAAILCGLSMTRSHLMQLWQVLYPRFIPALLMVLIGIAALTAQPVTWGDAGYYQAQMIQWLGRFGAVPGLVLLFNHFGFASSWFALATPFNGDFLQGGALAVMNGFALLLAVLQGCVSLCHIYTRPQLSDWFMACFSVILLPIVVKVHPILAEIVISPSPDLPILFVTGTIAWTMIAIADSKKKQFVAQNRLIPVILASGAIALKFTAIPLFVVASLFYLFNPELKVTHLLGSILLVVTLLTPVAIHNVITSGCPVYPSEQFCFNLPWTPPIQAVKQVARATYQWIPQYKPASTDLMAQIPQRWNWLSKFVGNPELVVILIVASSVALVCLVIFHKRHSNSGWQWIVVLAFTGITFFAVTSPMMRFWFVYLALIPIFVLALYCQLTEKLLSRVTHFSNTIAKVPFFYLLVPLFLTTAILSSAPPALTQVLLPPGRSKIATTVVKVNDVVLSFPKTSRQCWTSLLPCVPKTHLPNQIQLRDPKRGIEAGFVRSKA